jgi:hypothetical protein
LPATCWTAIVQTVVVPEPWISFPALLAGAAAASAASAGSTSFQHAHVDEAGRVTVGSTHVSSLELSIGSLMPGEKVRARRVVAIEAGLAVRYALSNSSTDDDHRGVRDLVGITIKTADIGSDAAGSCTAFDGRTLYDGPRGAHAAGFGEARMGDQRGDRILVPGAEEALCFGMAMSIRWRSPGSCAIRA